MKLSWNLLGIQTPLLSPPDGDAGGGDAGGDVGDHGDAGDTGDAGEADAGEGDAGKGDGRHAAGDDDADPEDDGLAPEVANDPKRLRTRLRRLQRQMRPFRDVEGQLRDQSGRLLTPQEINRRFSLAQDQEELNAFFAEHPDTLEQILERKRGGGRRTEAVDEFKDPFADPAAIGIDVTDPAGKWIVDQLRGQAKENFDLKQTLKRIEQGLGGVQQQTQQDRLTRVEQTWKENTLGAAKTAGLSQEDTVDFVNNVYRDFRLLGAEKKLDKADVRAVIARNLRPFARHAAGRSRGQAAQQQRTAQRNGERPQPQRQGAPTTAQAKTNNRETIRDGRTSFFARAGQAPPAGR